MLERILPQSVKEFRVLRAEDFVRKTVYSTDGALALALNTKQLASCSFEIPQVTRDTMGRVSWNTKDNSPEENEQMGIRNIQALFLERYPEFVELFLQREGWIAEDKSEAARTFILDRIGAQNKFIQHFGGSPLRRNAAFYFEGKYHTVVNKAFGVWGINFNFPEDTSLHIPRDSRGRIKWEQMSNDKRKTFIEVESQKFFDRTGNLNTTILSRPGSSWLRYAISSFYPGGILQIQKNLGVPIDRRKLPKEKSDMKEEFPPRDENGNIHWRRLRNHPELRIQLMECEAKNFLNTGKRLTIPALQEAGLNSLVSAAYSFYPGGFSELQAKVGYVTQLGTTNWKTVLDENGLPRDSSGRMIWSKLKENPEVIIEAIEQEAKRFISEGNHLNQENLKAAGLSGLGRAVQLYYPGRMEELKRKLEVTTLRPQRSQNYWTPDVTRKEVLIFYRDTGDLSYSLLLKNNRADLHNAIRKYPGGMSQLKIDLNIAYNRKPEGYWPKRENIEREAQEIFDKEGDISFQILKENKKSTLAYAIGRYYPGKMKGLRMFLGLTGEYREKDYWNRRTIEIEASKILAEYGNLTGNLLTSLGRNDLLNAINKKYPGAMSGLKIKLGILTYAEIRKGKKSGNKFQNSFETLTPEQKIEINEKYWDFVQENPNSTLSILDFAARYLPERRST